ncbi:MAG: hypothetical protein ABIR27_05465 [Dokdonella sp.]
MKLFPIFVGLISVIVFTEGATGAQVDAGQHLVRDWRITRVAPAPWATTGYPQNPLLNWIGKTVEFDAVSVNGPGELNCDHAKLEKTSYAAESLFQGNLPKPVATAAQQLGIAHLPRPGIRLTCSTGIFEFHYADKDTMLIGLDNQIVTLSRSPGTLADAASPEGRMQQFLEVHFNDGMGFDAGRLDTYRDWLSTRLDTALAAYFAKPAVADEVPEINGDPFTDSQSYPTRFSVGEANVTGDRLEIPVRFSDAFTDHAIVYVLLRERGGWQLDDVRYKDGNTLVGLIQ